MEKLSWSKVFNPKYKYGGTLRVALEDASNAGYEYVAWNGRVYKPNFFYPDDIGTVEDVMLP